MNSSSVIDLMNHATSIAAYVGLPTLLTALVVGVTISIFQAITQIQEMTLTFVPKIISIGAILYFLGPWMLHKLMYFTTHVFTELLLTR